MTQYSVEPFSKTTTAGSIGKNGDLNVSVTAVRRLRIESTIISGSGMVNNVVWVQNLEYNNVQSYLSNATIQVCVITFLHFPILFLTSLFVYLERTSNCIWDNVVNA